jgi:3-hydroxybutyryl-CoA dehydrogenase
MRIAVIADDDQWAGLTGNWGNTELLRVESMSRIPSDADACICLLEDEPLSPGFTTGPLLMNAVNCTLADMGAPPNTVRINGWNSFLNNETWELAGTRDHQVESVIQALGKHAVWVPDQPGFISPRIIAMIINEAYFALGDGISSKEEIDTAMKLGTGYPYGPFEWASLIGHQRIYSLLQNLSIHDKRYLPAGLLAEALNT